MTSSLLSRAPALAGIVAFSATLLLVPFVRSAARRWGFLDRPNQRSLHTQIVPRAGGVAILLAVGLTLALAPALWWQGRAEEALLVGTLILAAVGLFDDRFGLSPAVRLAFQGLTATAFVYAAGGVDRLPLPRPLDVTLGPLGPAIGVLWIVAVVNFYNFMDGIDGLASLQAAVTGAGLALAGFDPFASLLGAALAGGAAAFLIYNWSPASVFLGDVGSGAIGFTLAAVPFLAAPESRAPTVSFVAISLWLFLADPAWTLLRRLARGERLLQAHRGHLYQRLVSTGWSHARVSGGLGVTAAMLTVAALVGLRSARPGAHWAPMLVAVVVFGVEIALVARREAKRAGGEAKRYSM